MISPFFYATKYRCAFASLGILVFLLSSCGESNNEPQKSITQDTANTAVVNTPAASVTDTPAKPAAATEPPVISSEATFVIKKSGDDANPQSTIKVDIGGKQIEIAKVSGEAQIYQKGEYKEKAIPADALTACGSWWAGAGDYFYLKTDNGKIVVYKGWQEEGQAGNDYHWKKLKVLP